MEIVKKNILSIIFGVLALIAVIAWIWPLGSVKAEAEQALTKRAAVGSSMLRLSRSARRPARATSSSVLRRAVATTARREGVRAQIHLKVDTNIKAGVAFGGPLRLRVPRQLGYKSVKFLNRVTVTDSLKGFVSAVDPQSANYGYSWYAGI